MTADQPDVTSAPRAPSTRTRLSVTVRVFVVISVLLGVLAWYSSLEIRRDRLTLRRVATIGQLSSEIGEFARLELALANEAFNGTGLEYATAAGFPASVVTQMLGIDLAAQLAAARTASEEAVRELGARSPVSPTELVAARDERGGIGRIQERVAAARETLMAELRHTVAIAGAGGNLDIAVDELTLSTRLADQLRRQTFATVDLIFPITGIPAETRLRNALLVRSSVKTSIEQLAAFDDKVGAAVRAVRDAPSYQQMAALADDQISARITAGGAGQSFSIADVAKLRELWQSDAKHQELARSAVELATASLNASSDHLAASMQGRVARQAAVLLATLLVVLALSWWIFRTIVRPVQALERRALELAAGDPPAQPLRARGARELRVAAEALNQLVAALTTVERQATALAAGEVESPALVQHLPGRLGGALTGAVHRLSDSISRSQELTERLEHEASHDGLTALANRRVVLPTLERSIRRSDEHGVLVAALFIDLDRFKSVNDRFGHDAGDAVLVTVADRLRSLVRSADLIARLGGDEFLVLVEQMPTVDLAIDLAARIVAAVESPIALRDGKGTTVRVSASVGVAVHRPGQGADELLSLADQAMYDAKAAGRGRVVVLGAEDTPSVSTG